MATEKIKTPGYYVKFSIVMLLLNIVLIFINFLVTISRDNSESYREAIIKSEKPAWAATLIKQLKKTKKDGEKIKEHLNEISNNIPKMYVMRVKLSKKIAPTIKLIISRIEKLKKYVDNMQMRIQKLKIKIVSIQEHPKLKKK